MTDTTIDDAGAVALPSWMPDETAYDNIDRRDVVRVYNALRDRHDAGRTYVSYRHLDVNLSPSKTGMVLAELTGIDDCPLNLERWSGECTTPAVYEVSRDD